MEHIRWRPTPLAVEVGHWVDSFTLIDIGCSGGIDSAWRQFGPSLRAWGFDAVAGEIERLQAAETNPEVRYHAGFVNGASDDPVWWIRNPSARLSYLRSDAVRAGRHFDFPDAAEPAAWKGKPAGGDSNQGLDERYWSELRLSTSRIDLPAFLGDRGVADIDFVKIDVDGPDFDVLKALETTLRDCQVLGAQLEVTFFGSEDPNHHTFHNTDRFMRACGFELFKLSTITYSSAALPAPYLWASPGPTAFGRPLVGDAVYLRDFGWKLPGADPDSYAPLKHAKLAALFALYDLPDLAAEVLVRSRARLAGLIDVDAALDLLVRQVGGEGSYAEYIARFEAGAPEFFAQPQPSPPTAG